MLIAVSEFSGEKLDQELFLRTWDIDTPDASFIVGYSLVLFESDEPDSEEPAWVRALFPAWCLSILHYHENPGRCRQPTNEEVTEICRRLDLHGDWTEEHDCCRGASSPRERVFWRADHRFAAG